MSVIGKEYSDVLEGLKTEIVSSRYRAVFSINKELLLLYHHIGVEIFKLQAMHGGGAEILAKLSHDLKAAFPEMKGFSPRNLKYMCRFVEECSNLEFVQEVLAQLSWYHHVTLLEKVPNKETRLFS